MSDGQITNGQRAAHALDGINAHARSSARQEHGMSKEHLFFDFDRDTEPGADHARLADLLRDLHHYADRRGLNFDDAFTTARRDDEGQRTTYQPGDAIRLPKYQVEFITRRKWIGEPDLEAAPRFPTSPPGSRRSARQAAAQASPVRLRVQARRPGTCGALL